MDEPFKLCMRVTHMISVAILSGRVIYTYHSDGELDLAIKENPNYGLLNNCIGFTIAISGLVNIFLIKGGKKLEDPVHAIWQHLFELKFVVYMLLTPMIYPLTSFFAEEGS